MKYINKVTVAFEDEQQRVDMIKDLLSANIASKVLIETDKAEVTLDGESKCFLAEFYVLRSNSISRYIEGHPDVKCHILDSTTVYVEDAEYTQLEEG